MSRLRLAAAQLICVGLPPPVAGWLGKRIYPLAQGRSDDFTFVRRAQTGSRFTGTTADFHAHQFAIRGHDEWRNWGIAKALVSPGDTIIEIGANVGTETVGFSDLVGATGRVLAFEPLPDGIAALERTLPLTTHRNVELFPLAVGAEQATVRFAAPPRAARSQGTGHILGPEEGERDAATYGDREVDWPIIEVECVTLDSLAERLGAARFMHVDAEGSEIRILHGATRYIRAHMPVIALEASPGHLSRAGASIEELHSTLVELGYVSFAIKRLGLERLDDPNSSIAAGNWLCLPESETGAARSVERFLRKCALAPRILGLNPLSPRPYDSRRPRVPGAGRARANRQ